MKKWVAWVGVLLSLVAVGILLWRVDLRALTASIAAADFRWLAASFALFFLMFLFRAWRWARLLGLDPRTKLGVTWHANIIGYMFNILLPLRLGELARAWIIAKKTDVGIARALSAVMVERLVDLASVIVLFAGFAQVVPMRASFNRAALFGATAFVIALAAVVVLVVKGESTERWVRGRFGERSETWLGRFRDIRMAFRSIGTARGMFTCGALSIAVWVTAILTAELCMKGFLPVETSLTKAGLMVVTANLGGALPSAPGGLGIVQGFATSALVVPFGIDEGRALAFVLVWSLGQQLVLVLLGLFSMVRVGISFGEIRAGVSGPKGK